MQHVEEDPPAMTAAFEQHFCTHDRAMGQSVTLDARESVASVGDLRRACTVLFGTMLGLGLGVFYGGVERGSDR